MSNDPLPDGRHIVTAGSVQCNRDTHENARSCTKCCYVGVPDGVAAEGEKKRRVRGEETDLEENAEPPW